VPITFPGGWGKTLRVPDGHAGKWVRRPACRETAIVPEAAPDPAFEVVEDESPPTPEPRVWAESAPVRLADDEPPPRPRTAPTRSTTARG
jgi:hypothetical protein